MSRSTVTTATGRSRYLRRQASRMHPLVASAYRRRASELELVAWALGHDPASRHVPHHDAAA